MGEGTSAEEVLIDSSEVMYVVSRSHVYSAWLHYDNHCMVTSGDNGQTKVDVWVGCGGR